MKTALPTLILTALLSGCAASAQPPAAAAGALAPATEACADHDHAGKAAPRPMKRAGMRRHHADGKERLAAGLRSLDLSETQRTAIDKQLDAAREGRRQYRAQRRDLREAFVALDPAARDYAAQSEKLSARAAELARAEMLSRTELKSALGAVLTPEQREQWQAQQKARKDARARPAPRDARPQA